MGWARRSPRGGREPEQVSPARPGVLRPCELGHSAFSGAFAGIIPGQTLHYTVRVEAAGKSGADGVAGVPKRGRPRHCARTAGAAGADVARESRVPEGFGYRRGARARLTLEVSVTSRVGVTRGRCDADGRDSGTGVGFGVGVALALVRRAARGAQGASAWPIPSPSSRQPNKRAGRDGSSARVSRLRRPGRSARLSGGTTVAGEARPPSQSPEVPPPEAQTPAL